MKKEKADLLRDKYARFFKKAQTIESLRGHEIFSDEDIGTYGTLFDNAHTNDEEILTNVYKKFSTLPDFISLQPITTEKTTIFYLKYDFGPGNLGGSYQTIFSSDLSEPTVELEDVPEITISIASKNVSANCTLQLDDMVTGIMSNLDLKDVKQEKINNFTKYERARIAVGIYANTKTGGCNRDIKYSLASKEAHLIVYTNEASYLGVPIILSPCEIDNNNVLCCLMINPSYAVLITSDNPYTGKIDIEKF